MATLPYFLDAGRANLTPEQVRLLEPLFRSLQQGTGESMEFQREAEPYAYAQQSPDYQMLAMYDPQGQYLGDDKRNTETADKNLQRFIAASLAAYGGAQMLGEAGLADSALGGDISTVLGAGGPGEPEAIMSALSSADKAALYGNAGYGAGMTGAQTGAFDAILGATGSPALANVGGNVAGLGGNTGLWDVARSVGSAVPWSNLAGAALGAATSRDQTQSASRAPWEPAQPFLQSLLGQGQQLQKQYAEQPFTPQQQTGYNNVGGLLNTTNSQLGGLLGGFGANASGANNFDRSNPRRQLTGGAALDLSSFLPGLLNFFPRGG